MNKLQTINNKKDEIEFRERLVKQHIAGRVQIKGQADNKAILKELQIRLKRSRLDFKDLQKKRVILSPYLEIGAEKCQRSMLLENEFKGMGFAADLSFHSLASAPYFGKKLGFSKIPKRICLDAYNLPFKNNSIRFIFFYQTLHHFPDPKPILKEALRVLRSDGYIFFSEEPIKQIVNLNLFRRDYKLNWFEKILKSLLILPFISKIGRSEVESGIIEEEFLINQWEEILADFDYLEAEIKPLVIGGPVNFFRNTHQEAFKIPFLTRVLLAVQGGGIKVLGKANKDSKADLKSSNLLNLFSCPNCDNSSLKKSKNSLLCNSCKQVFNIKNGIFILLSQSNKKLLNL